MQCGDNDVVQCGICHSHVGDERKTFYCPSCISFKLLKYNLNKINLQNLNSIAINDISKVLEVCFGDNMKKFLSQYIDGDDNVVNLMGTNVSIKSVAQLAFMLLSVEMIKRGEKINKITQMIVDHKKKSEILSKKIELLKKQKKIKIKVLGIYNKKLSSELVENINNHENVKKILEEGIINRQEAIITLTRRMIIFDVLTLWNVEIFDSKKLTILFTPIVSIDKIVHYSMDLIMQSFIKTCELVDIIGRTLNIKMPFEINSKCNNLEIGDAVFQFGDKKDIFTLNKFELLQFCVGISRMILNIVILLREVDISFKFENISLIGLLSYDILLIRLINKVKEMIFYDKIVNKKVENLIEKKQRIMDDAKLKHKISLWRKWFSRDHHKNIADQMIINDNQTDNYMFRSNINNEALYNEGFYNEGFYNEVLKNSLIILNGEFLKNNIDTKQSLNAAPIPAGAIDGHELIRDHRLLAENVYCFIRDEMEEKVLNDSKKISRRTTNHVITPIENENENLNEQKWEFVSPVT